jgi:hypothetical protein
MRKLGLLALCFALTLGAGIAPSWAASWFIDAENGADSASCGSSASLLAASSTGPCASLNTTLAHAAANDTITVVHGATWGPIYLTGQIAISGPGDNSMVILNTGAAPGCIGGAPGSCASANSANAAVEIAAGASDTIKLKGFIVNGGSSGTSSIHIASAFTVSTTGVVYRSSNNSTLTAMLYDNSTLPSSGTPHQVYMHNCDVAFSGNGGGVLIEPSVPTSVHISGGEFHHAKYGVRVQATNLASGTVNTVIDTTEFFSFNNNAVTVIAAGPASAAVSLSRSTISQTGTAGLVVSGADATATIYEDVITQSNIGVDILGGIVYSLGNNEIYFNGTNISGGSLTTSPPSLQ